MSYLTNPHDHFFKELMSRPGIAADFMANYLPPEVVATLDVTAPELVKDSFIDEELREHRSDMLYSVRRVDGGEAAYVYVLFEHKSAPDTRIAWQLLRYIIKIWEMLLREGAIKLPPILPVVFYHGAEEWRISRRFSALIEIAGDDPLRAYAPEFSYHLCDLSAYDHEQIKGAALLQAGLRLMQAVFTQDFKQTLEEVFDLLLREPQPSAMEYLQTILRYAAAAGRNLTPGDLRAVVEKKLPKPEAMKLMSTPAQIWLEQGIEQGILQGIRQNQLQTTHRLAEHALNTINRRFGAVDEQIQSRVRSLTFDQLGELIESLFDFHSTEDLAAWLGERAAGESETLQN